MINKTCKFRVNLYKGLIRIIVNYTAEPVCHVFNLNVKEKVFSHARKTDRQLFQPFTRYLMNIHNLTTRAIIRIQVSSWIYYTGALCSLLLWPFTLTGSWAPPPLLDFDFLSWLFRLADRSDGHQRAYSPSKMKGPINVENWITGNQDAFLPPVCNKLMWVFYMLQGRLSHNNE